MSTSCRHCGAVAPYGQEIGHRSDCPSLSRGPGVARLADETWEFRIAKLALEPGDVLLVKTDRTPVRLDALLDITRKLGARLLLIPTDVDLSVLTRVEIEERAK